MPDDQWVSDAQAQGYDVAGVMRRAAKSMLQEAEAPRDPEPEPWLPKRDEVWVMRSRLPDGRWETSVISPVMQDSTARSETSSFAETRYRLACLWQAANPSVDWAEHIARATRADIRVA